MALAPVRRVTHLMGICLFAIGYGLDHAERYRNLSYVAALKD